MAQVDFGKFVKNRLASLVSFNNSGTDITGTNVSVQDALVQLANRHFGKQFAWAYSEPDFIDNTGVFQLALRAQSPNAPNGRYILFWHYRQNSSKSNTDSTTEVRINGIVLSNEVVSGAVFLGGNKGLPLMSFREFNFVGGPANLNLDLYVRRSSGNGDAFVNSSALMLFRVS